MDFGESEAIVYFDENAADLDGGEVHYEISKERDKMCKLSISVKNEYVYINIKNKTIKYYVPHVLEKYTSVKKFDKENGTLTLTAKLNRLDGTTTEEEDWIDLNDSIAFAFKNPQSIIREIDKVEIA